MKINVRTKSPTTVYNLDENTSLTGGQVVEVELDEKITRAIKGGILVKVGEVKKTPQKATGTSKLQIDSKGENKANKVD